MIAGQSTESKQNFHLFVTPVPVDSLGPWANTTIIHQLVRYFQNSSSFPNFPIFISHVIAPQPISNIDKTGKEFSFIHCYPPRFRICGLHLWES